jgi:sporulation protein YlmC with PRC-barrel domain
VENVDAAMLVVTADALEGEAVVDAFGAALGTIEDIVIDVARGTITHALVATGVGAPVKVPWTALRRDASRRCFVLAPATG